METFICFGIVVVIITVVGCSLAAHNENVEKQQAEEKAFWDVRQKEQEKERAARLREQAREIKQRERERLAAIAREKRAQEKEFNSKDKQMMKIEKQLSNPSSFRELCSAITSIDNFTPDERNFLAEHAQSRYPSIYSVQKSGKDQRMIDYMDRQFDDIRVQALRPIDIDEFASEIGKIIKPFETCYQDMPKNAKNHYDAFTSELFGRWGDK